ncbi:MAG: Ribosomal RNA small subunit methyltransferase H [Gemmatimonadaceae bacterium]|nr:Ribosomal RNA small subunit methyltransferase H [Gemmatimonadaceae bacterium]
MTVLLTYQSSFHAPVLAREVVQMFRDARHVLDCTLGGGGHAQALLENGADVTGVDRDPEAIRAATARLVDYAATGRFRAYLTNYAQIAESELTDSSFDGILLDLGVSSHQLDDATRGFSFRPGAPLDMRMGVGSASDAAGLLNDADESTLAFIFREYADERRALRLAREIVHRRVAKPFALSDDLVNAIRAALGSSAGPHDFARLFQAVRIEVNDELAGLERALPELRDRLVAGGTLVVIAYHSGEDRIVKNAFRSWSADCVCQPKQPVCTCRGHSLGSTITRRPVTASEEETARNVRARSARLRAWRRAA